MPKDYAKQGHHAHRSGRKSNAPGWLWLTAGILLGLFVASLFYLKQHSLPSSENSIVVTTSQPKEPNQSAKKDQAKNSQPANKPRFDFYTILPQNKVSTPDQGKEIANTPETKGTASTLEETTLTASPEPPANNLKVKPIINSKAALAKEQYFLAIAAYKRYADADQLKAQLSLLGFNANITAIKRQGILFNRVWLGPYANHAAADKERLRLLNYHIKGILLKQKNN